MANLFHSSLGKLFVQDRGTGPALLCIHGFLENHSMWDFLNDLETEYRIIRVDLPGHGHSEVAKQDFSLSDLATVLKELLHHLQVDTFHYIGHSMGGYIGLELAKQCTQSMHQLILFHSQPFADKPKKKIERERLIEALKQGKSQFLRLSLPGLMAPHRLPHLQQELNQLLAMAENCSLTGAIHALQAMKSRKDHRILTASMRARLAVVSGQQDPTVPLNQLQDWTNEYECPHVLIPDCGHLGFLEQPSLCRGAIRELLTTYLV